MIRMVVMIVLLLVPGLSVAGDLWPELRFGRMQAVMPVSQPTVSLGAGMAAGDVDRRVATSGRLGLGYVGPLVGATSWQLGVFGVESTRGRAGDTVFGHTRLAVSGTKHALVWAVGGDFWAGAGMNAWARSASPFGAVAWRHARVRLGAAFSWARSGSVGPLDRLMQWREQWAGAYNPTFSIGLPTGPVDLLFSYNASFSRGGLARDAVVAEARYPLDFGIGQGVPYLMVRTPAGQGRMLSRFTAELGMRLQFDVRATQAEVFPTEDGDKEAPAPFDPFG